MKKWLKNRWLIAAMVLLAYSAIATVAEWQLLPVFAMPTFEHGKNTVFKITDAGAALRDISNVLTNVGFPASIETAETSAFGSTSKSYIVGLVDHTISIEGGYDATVDGYLAGLVGFATARVFEFGPQGGTAGKVKYTGSCFLTKYEISNPLDDKATFSAEFQVTGDVTKTTF
jgi:hypothetical protein